MRRIHGILVSGLLYGGLMAAEVVAHRGSSSEAPENTIAAAKLAIDQGADSIECDIFLTTDGKLAVLHDQNTKRTTGVDNDIEKITSEQAKALDAAVKYKDTKYAGEKIPMLEELLAAIPDGKRLMIEIKTAQAAARPVLKSVLEKSGKKASQIQIISFNFGMLQAVKKENPQYEVLLLAGYKKDKDAKAPNIDDLIAKTKAASLDGLSLSKDWPYDDAFVKKVHDAGLKLYVWTVNDLSEAQKLVTHGADGIVTDKPHLMRTGLK